MPGAAAEWTLTVPADGTLGEYSVQAILESDRPDSAKTRTRKRSRAAKTTVEYGGLWTKIGPTDRSSSRPTAVRISAWTSRSAPRRPSPATRSPARSRARYLFGAPMMKRPAHWTLTRTPVAYDAPGRGDRRPFPQDRWTFVGALDETTDAAARMRHQDDGDAAAAGDAAADAADGERPPASPTSTRSRETSRTSRGSTSRIARRSSCIPAPWYIGDAAMCRTSPIRRTASTPSSSPVGLDGAQARACPVDVTLTQIQWNSVRRAEGNGFYTWDTERKDVPAGEWTVTTAADPVPLTIPHSERRVLRARSAAPTPTTDDSRSRARRSTRSARATRRGPATTTTASTSCPSARPTSPATRRAS